MVTLIRPKISEKNRYWIDKHRHYELKHFCLQYPEWKKRYADLDCDGILSSSKEKMPSSNIHSDPTARIATVRAQLKERIEMIEKIAREADECIGNYILKAVTENLSYTHLKTKCDIPCGRDMYYDRYRKFFWLLSRVRG